MTRIRLVRASALAAVTLVALALSASASPAPSPSATRANMNSVQTAAAAGQFTTLVKLVKQAGLASALSAPGPLTVFAPT
ncbi:MAG: fasciclin domain-containing protein, partial [Gaiellaceae bacterium]